jgi:hypothetical protein
VFISYLICAPGKYFISGKRIGRIWDEGREGANREREGWDGKVGRG